MKNIRILPMIFIALLTFGCSKEKENSQVQFNLSEFYKSKISAYSEIPKNVYIQVTSPDYVNEVYFFIDCLSVNCQSVNIEVPPGRDSLLQLAILTEANGHPKQLFYGDKKQNLIAGVNASVAINLQVLSDFSKEAIWSGRLKNENGSFPSGQVHPKLHIQDKPAFWIPNLNFLMINGWFRTHFFNNFKVSFWLNKNQKLFSNVATLSNTISFDELSARAVQHASSGSPVDFHLSIPSHYVFDIATSAVDSDSQYDLFAGYYGSQAVTGFCVDDNSNFLVQDTSQKWCQDALCTNVLNSDVSNTGDVITSIPVNALSVCTTGNYLTAHPVLRKSQLMQSKSLMGIHLPLRATLVSGKYIFINSIETTTNVYSISGNFLPDTSSFFTQVELFALNTGSSLKKEDYCQNKTSSQFTKIGNLAINQATNSFSGSLSFDPSLNYDHFLCFSNNLNLSMIQYYPLNLNSNPAAVLSISESSPYDYGFVTIGNTIPHTFTVTNSGNVAATTISGSGLATPFDFTGGTYPGVGGTCGTTLASGSSCIINVNFTPSGTSLSSDTIDLSYNDGSTAQITSRDIEGTGLTPALLTLSDGPTYDYGTKAVGSTTSYFFTVTNSGGTTATGLTGSGLVTPFQFTGGSYPGTSGTCGASLTVGSSCTLSVNYNPVGTGLIADTIDISYNDGSTGQITSRNIQGTGIIPATLVISDGPTYDYGTIGIGTPVDKTFTVTNSGGSTATSLNETGLAAPFVFKGGSYPGTGGSCGGTIVSTGSCNIVITFTPGSTTLFTDTIELNYNDGTSLQLSLRNIQGTGL